MDRENYNGSVASKLGCAVLIAAVWAAIRLSSIFRLNGKHADAA